MRDAPARGVLHTVEANYYRPSQDDYYGHRNPPHFTITTGGVAYQHYTTARAARALRHPRRTPDTNRMNAIQIELVGYARSIHLMPGQQFGKLREIMRWIESVHGVRREAPLEFRGPEAYGEDAPYRISDKEWAKFNAWLGHQHVPNNSHWDPGKINIDALLARSEWEQPGDPVRVGSDAIEVAKYQGGKDQARLVAQISEEETQIMVGRLLDIAMQHDLRLIDLEE
jgi:hypothetical protein